MTQAERLADDLRRSVEGPAWHGPSLLQALAEVTAEEAAARPVAGVHSIWEVTNHAAAWIGVVERRFLGTATELNPQQNWPEVLEPGEAAWRSTIAALRASQESLVQHVRGASREVLAAGVPGRDYDNAHMLAGLAQHNAYHAGQISLLHRAFQQLPKGTGSAA